MPASAWAVKKRSSEAQREPGRRASRRAAVPTASSLASRAQLRIVHRSASTPEAEPGWDEVSVQVVFPAPGVRSVRVSRANWVLSRVPIHSRPWQDLGKWVLPPPGIPGFTPDPTTCLRALKQLARSITKGKKAYFANIVYFIMILKMHVQTTHGPIFPRKDLVTLPYHLPPPHCFKYLTMKRETDESN